jgi:hypothetical protein
LTKPIYTYTTPPLRPVDAIALRSSAAAACLGLPVLQVRACCISSSQQPVSTPTGSTTGRTTGGDAMGGARGRVEARGGGSAHVHLCTRSEATGLPVAAAPQARAGPLVVRWRSVVRPIAACCHLVSCLWRGRCFSLCTWWLAHRGATLGPSPVLPPDARRRAERGPAAHPYAPNQLFPRVSASLH